MQDTLNYNYLTQKLRYFFQQKKGFIEAPTQSRLSVLAACEDPKTISMFNFQNTDYPLPQTGQMALELELLQNPSAPGFFCITTSYRDEKAIIEGRHQVVFPIFEFEARGGIEDLKKIESELLEFLGFNKPIDLNYEDACTFYKTDELEHDHELKMHEDFSSSILLQNFPTRTHPFWNMKYAGDNIFKKVDVILYGMETFGSAERSTNVEEMREMFFSVEHGKYAKTLFKKCGRERVLKELDEYFSLPMIPRYGVGIGLHRVVRAMEIAKIDYHHSIVEPASETRTQPQFV